MRFCSSLVTRHLSLFLKFRWSLVTCHLSLFLLAFAMPGETRERAALEKKLTQSVQQLYQVVVTGDWAKGESFLTKDSLDLWRSQPKSKIEGFQVQEVKMAPDGKQAQVTVSIATRVPQFPGPFTQSLTTEWVYQKNRWLLKLKPAPSAADIFKSGAAALNENLSPPPLVFGQNPIRIPRPAPDTDTVVKVPYQNVTPFTVSIQNLSTTCVCLKAEMDTKTLSSEQEGVLTLTYHPVENAAPNVPVSVQALISPPNYTLKLPVLFSGE